MIPGPETGRCRGAGFAPVPGTPGTHGPLRHHLMQGAFGCDAFMNICCPRCGGLAEPAGHEDARAFFQCPTCSRVWATHISASATHTFPTANAPRVLIADDSREILGLLTAWLEDEGCVVIAAASGRETIDAAVAYKPDVALIDVVLPPPDGYYVCEVLTRKMGIAVLLMTGMSAPDSRRIEEVGALELLRKPFDREALLDALTRALDRGRRKETSGGAAFATH
jgi:CheY-like chemotaxis protein